MRICLFGGPGVGKCFGKDTLILMYDGTTKFVQDVVVGDLVMGDDSKPRKVLDTTSGVENLYLIRPSNKIHSKDKKVPPFTDEYIVNESHILALKLSNEIKSEDDRGNIANDDKVNISVLDYINKPEKFKNLAKGYRANVHFDNRDVLVDPYILGLWLGGGSGTLYKVAPFNDRFVKLIDKAANLRGYCGELNHKYTSEIQDEESVSLVVDYLHSQDLFKNKYVPQEYKINSEEIRLELLAGLMDSNSSDSYFNFISKNFKLACDVAWLCRSVGLYACITEHTETYQSSENCKHYKVQIHGECGIVNASQSVKKVKDSISTKDILKYKIEVCPLGVGEYYGFSVDGNHLFLLGDFTVVHNSTLAHWLTSELAKANVDVEYVDEWIKRLAYQKAEINGWMQRHVFNRQLEKEEFFLRHGVSTIVTDSPLLMQLAYMDTPEAKRFIPLCLSDIKLFNEEYDSINIFLDRGDLPYKSLGRWQTHEEAMHMDMKIKSLMEENLSVFYEFSTTDWDGIFKEVFVRLKSCKLI